MLRQRCIRLGHGFKVAWWFFIHPNTRGVKCIVEHEGKFLLVKLAYSHRCWSIPGGGVKRGESFESAAKRELLEEADILLSQVRLIGSYNQSIEYKNDTVQCYHSVVDDNYLKIDNSEISEACWFTKDTLPVNRTPSVDKILNML